MAEQNAVYWPGALRTYTYWFAKAGVREDVVAEEPGNYLFAKQIANGNWIALYVGIAENLRERLKNHERWAEASAAGATHFMVHINRNALARAAEEQDLIRTLQPPLNSQLRAVS